MGGGIALRYALRFPERVGKIVLSDSAGLGREVIWTLRWMSLPMVGELFSHPTRKGVEFALNLAVGNRVPITGDFVQLHYRFFRQPGYGKFFLKILRGMVTIKGAREETIAPIIRDLHKIEQPVLIIWGEQDRVLPLKHAYVAAEKLPRATLKIFDKCGHLPFFEQPEEFNRIVLEFLSE
jgi:4,5:9,10-diseco-3-hydroxy-5,9,17-trioxoandrosta-1(10),2-diene-4-oate hydrolase